MDHLREIFAQLRYFQPLTGKGSSILIFRKILVTLRSLGFPARYVSGYLETMPPPGQEKLVGSDASHAWFAVFSPEEGWLEFDPTNDNLPAEHHITTAWGRDYGDVSPLKGVFFDGGESQKLKVSVDVTRL